MDTGLVVGLAVLVGVTLGLFGGGGSILTVPLLVYVAGQDAKVAIATSLLVVGVTSAVGALDHARAGRVRWRTGVTFGGAGMVGAYLGGRLGAHVDGTILLIAFGLMMAATSVAMLRGRSPRGQAGGHAGHTWRILVDGVVVGLVTGLVGAGGGFLVVPALVLLGGLRMETAVGTSLLVIAMKSFAGLAGYLGTVTIDWSLAGAVTVAAVVGALLGGRLVAAVPAERLRRGFAWFVAAMSLVVLAEQMPGVTRAVLTSELTWALGALGVAAWSARTVCRTVSGCGTAPRTP
jgi:uncharacterized protein